MRAIAASSVEKSGYYKVIEVSAADAMLVAAIQSVRIASVCVAVSYEISLIVTVVSEFDVFNIVVEKPIS